HAGWVRTTAFSADGTRIASGGYDTTTMIWDAANAGHVATLLGGRDGEWLTLTQAGFFTGSRQVEQLITMVRRREVTTIDQVHQSLFNPDLVREAFAGDPNGEVREAGKAINLEKVVDSGPPPFLAITSPSEGSRLLSDLATVTARIEDRGK